MNTAAVFMGSESWDRLFATGADAVAERLEWDLPRRRTGRKYDPRGGATVLSADAGTPG